MKYLITSIDCPHCPPAKELAEELDIEILNAEESEKAVELAEQFGIMYVPCFVDNNKIYTYKEYKEKVTNG